MSCVNASRLEHKHLRTEACWQEWGAGLGGDGGNGQDSQRRNGVSEDERRRRCSRPSARCERACGGPMTRSIFPSLRLRLLPFFVVNLLRFFRDLPFFPIYNVL